MVCLSNLMSLCYTFFPMFMSLAGQRAGLQPLPRHSELQRQYLFLHEPDRMSHLLQSLLSCNFIGAHSYLAITLSSISIMFILNKADVYTIMDFLQSPESPPPWAQCRQVTASISGVRHLRAEHCSVQNLRGKTDILAQT